MDFGGGTKAKIQLFQNIDMFDIKLKGCSPEYGVGSNRPNSTFSEYGHVVYQIKWNHECSYMVANILPENPHPLTLGVEGGS